MDLKQIEFDFKTGKGHLYRFKTEEEFKRDNQWENDHPFSWNSGKQMNEFMGQQINTDLLSDVDSYWFKYLGTLNGIPCRWNMNFSQVVKIYSVTHYYESY